MTTINAVNSEYDLEEQRPLAAGGSQPGSNKGSNKGKKGKKGKKGQHDQAEAPAVHDEFDNGPTSLTDQTIRMGFVRKVYGIVTAQLLFTTLFCALAMSWTPLGDFMIMNTWLLWVCLIIYIILAIVLSCFMTVARQVPTNYILLGIVTLTLGYVTAAICAMYQQAGEGSLVLIAAGLTCIMTFSLSLYACFTKTDITMWGGVLFCCAIGLLCFSLLAIIFQSNWLFICLCVVGVVLMGIFLVYDTQLIMGNKQYKLSEDDYIIGALALYTDIINIFLYLLQLLSYIK